MVERWTRDAQGFVTWPDGEWVRYSDYAALEAENERLRKALVPFAEAATYHMVFDDERPVRADGGVLVKHLRAARRALEGSE